MQPQSFVKTFIIIGLILCALLSGRLVQHATYAQPAPTPAATSTEDEPVACGGGGCPAGLLPIYAERNESCAPTYQDFKQNQTESHYWIEDPEVTDQGRADERARQFIAWVLNNNAIDNHPVLSTVWGLSRNIAYFFIMLVAAILGIGFIVGQRSHFDLKLKVWPIIGKIGGALLFVTFSAAIVILFIQLSELLMRFFAENLGADKIFNVFFNATTSQEQSYNGFKGCRDLNIRSQEAVKTQLFMLKLTNITYYVMGVMLLLRKILLWFMLFTSPFLAILLPFPFVRNIGWIWIGVFFQWLFYGPLFALFLGAVAKIWQAGIPFAFDFSRVDKIEGYVYPTATNILYGGPAQQLSEVNSGNYVDTFAEYIITLIMLWAVIVFPWWLLRFFRSYCCDGIYAMKNILMAMYDQSRGSPGPTPPSTPGPSSLNTKLTLDRDVQTQTKTRLETVEEIKRTKTEEITKTLNLSANKLTDIARLETNKQTREEIRKNLDYLSNPTKAQTPAERQKYMNLRTELFSRAIKQDTIAKQLLSATSSSAVDRVENRDRFIKTTPQTTQVSQVVSYKVKLPTDKISSITISLSDAIASKITIVNSIANATKVTDANVKSLLTSYKQNVSKPPAEVVDNISRETGVEKEKVAQVLEKVLEVLKQNKELAQEVAQKENVSTEQVEKVVQIQIPLMARSEQEVEQTIAIPQSVSIEDYEEVKKMWTHQYEKGEVPVTENISTRTQWIEQDILFITNTLNKLMSQDDIMKQQGLDEVGFILPIFMINNLKAEELLVYLKAKLEAAKVVRSQTERDQEVGEKIKAQAQEVLVDVPMPKQEEAEKTMSMSEELPIEPEKSENSTPLEPTKES
jgi:hypothetical protein